MDGAPPGPPRPATYRTRVRTCVRSSVRRLLARGAATIALAALCLPTAPAHARSEEPADPGPCSFRAKPYPGRPWPLQRVQLDEMWAQSRGKGVRVAVIDTGVDTENPQLTAAVETGTGTVVLPAGNPAPALVRGRSNGTTDEVGHGTRVAGIIAARPHPETGFVGLAPEATIIPIDQNDAAGSGTPDSLAAAIYHAVAQHADIINISQDTQQSGRQTEALRRAVAKALEEDVIVIASAGNDGTDAAARNTYPAAYRGVLAVAASDRDNERAYFSQPGAFVGVAAPGTDVVSTVPGGGHCADSGTSFSAPYVAGLAALLRSKHRSGHQRWTGPQVVAQIKQTAESATPGPDSLVGWGIVDPLRALTEDAGPVTDLTVARRGGSAEAHGPDPLFAPAGETPQERSARLAVYILTGSAVALVVLTGSAVTVRDVRRRGRWTAGDRQG